MSFNRIRRNQYGRDWFIESPIGWIRRNMSYGASKSGHQCCKKHTSAVIEMQQKVAYRNTVALVEMHQNSDSNKLECLFLANKCHSLPKCRLIHSHIICNGLESDIAVGAAVVGMYGRCKCVEGAARTLYIMPKANVVSWTVLISLYARQGYLKVAFALLWGMQVEGVYPNKVTCLIMIKSCSNLQMVAGGKYLHSVVVKGRLYSLLEIGNALLSMYGKCGNLKDAIDVFRKSDVLDIISWGALIAAYVLDGYASGAISLFYQMQAIGLMPNEIIFLIILGGFDSVEEIARGKLIHAYVSRLGLQSNMMVGNALQNMYNNCGSVGEARFVFQQMPERDAISWTTVIGNPSADSREVCAIFREMQQEGIWVDKVTFIAILKAHYALKSLGSGKLIHACILDAELELDTLVGTALVDMYGKCGSVAEAWRMFNKMMKHDVVAWNAMLAAYAQYGHGKKAVNLFKEMLQQSLKPDKVTFVNMMNACTSLTSLEECRPVHTSIMTSGLEPDIVLGTAIINMYGKCGSLEDAQKMFNEMPLKNTLTWTAMIAIYGHHGQGKEVLQFLNKMQQNGAKPDSVTILCILCACSHARLLDESFHIFLSFIGSFDTRGISERYGSIVDLLGRIGWIIEGEEFVSSFPLEPDVAMWSAIARYMPRTQDSDYVRQLD